MRTTEKVLSSVLVVGVLAGATTLGVFGAFSATTQSSGNEITAGTVTFGDDDAGRAMLSLTDARPGTSATRCIRGTYTGSLRATVRLHTSTVASGTLAPYVDLRITQGSMSAGTTFPSCTGFVPATRNPELYAGTLAAFGAAHRGFAGGIPSGPDGASTWSSGDTVVLRVVETLQPGVPDSAQGTSSGVHDFVWEARND